MKSVFIPYIKRTTDLIKILYDLGYSDPDVETMDIVFEAYKKYQKKTNIKDWKIAFRLQVNHDGKGFQSKQDVLTEIRKMKLNWTETKINIFLMKHFYIPKVKTELAKNYSIKYYEKSELKKVDEKYKSKPKDLKELLHRIESNNIEISDSMLTYLSQWIYNIRGAPAHIRKKKLKKVHDEIVTHIGRDPVDELEVEYIAHELDITTEIEWKQQGHFLV
ncbi:MAG: hypothetical protein U9R75_08835 [Candidatus Thermoplasmatota archaeon]|nr:hypothetical protein [Candidatus Thermoplasmatota archaeon]